MIAGLSHIAIRTSNILNSVRFYTEVLGLREAFRMYGEDGALSTVYIYIAPASTLNCSPMEHSAAKRSAMPSGCAISAWKRRTWKRPMKR